MMVFLYLERVMMNLTNIAGLKIVENDFEFPRATKKACRVSLRDEMNHSRCHHQASDQLKATN